ncbi:MAG: hypothetical protein FWB80_14440 [Defluviitaleaceae bacterium]|nr:hypothetical protein [Defluviitaleaceae bacterium]
MRNGLGRAKNRERLIAFFAIGETDSHLIRYSSRYKHDEDDHALTAFSTDIPCDDAKTQCLCGIERFIQKHLPNKCHFDRQLCINGVECSRGE